MKKLNLKPVVFLLFFLTINFSVFGRQNNEPELLHVIYNFIYVDDLNKPENPLKEEMYLRLGKDVSFYGSLTLTKSISKHFDAMMAKIEKSGSTSARGVAAAVVDAPGLTREHLYQYPSSGKLVMTVVMGNNDYKVESHLPKINWKITEQTRLIGKYTCQKATGVYAGRTYEAWFAPELPFQNGPWKLSGLPGLILEAKDTKNEVSFIFKEISKGVDPDEDYIQAITRRTAEISVKDCNRLKETFENNPVAAMKAQFTTNISPIISYVDADGNQTLGEAAEILIAAKKKAEKAKKHNSMELQ